ncbi:hypothetical protein FS749_013931, partial [Ceratobasidium sp. UAMH 11750]
LGDWLKSTRSLYTICTNRPVANFCSHRPTSRIALASSRASKNPCLPSLRLHDRTIHSTRRIRLPACLRLHAQKRPSSRVPRSQDQHRAHRPPHNRSEPLTHEKT